MPDTILTALQVILALGLLNVWLLRANSSTRYRGGDAPSLKEEFRAYGLPEWFFYLVGFLKIGSAVALIAGIGFPALVLPASLLVAALMLGALAMHVKVSDPLVRSVPAFLMLAMSSTLAAMTYA